MKAPTNLKHKPLVSLDDYCHFDGPYADHTDAQALSIGFAQYLEKESQLPNETLHNEELTAKVWRRPEKKWSRMSEELPIHRILDLTILYLSTLTDKPVKGGFQDLLKEHKRNGGKHSIRENYRAFDSILEPRFRTIKNLLEAYYSE